MAVTASDLARILENEHVRLTPFEETHRLGVAEAGSDKSIWRYSSNLGWGEHSDSWFDDARAEQSAGERVPFAVTAKSIGEIVGSTSYLTIRSSNSSVEIGWTWYRPDQQRSVVNPSCKLLLLEHAFECGALRVEFKADARNAASLGAMTRLGFVREGTLRKHTTLHDGYQRDSVFFSVIREEWPATRSIIEERLAERL